MEDSLQFDYIFKYILVGDASVGKSTILSMFISNQFKGESNPTMGVEFATKKLQVLGKVVKVQIWDTAGQQSFRTITRAYYKNAIGIILVYDVTNPKSFQSIESWMHEINDNSNEKAEIILIGNKIDLVSKPNIDSPIKNMTYFCTSAKTGLNINKLFIVLTQSILKKVKSGAIVADGTYGVKKGGQNRSMKLKNDGSGQQQEKKSKCC